MKNLNSPEQLGIKNGIAVFQSNIKFFSSIFALAMGIVCSTPIGFNGFPVICFRKMRNCVPDIELLDEKGTILSLSGLKNWEMIMRWLTRAIRLLDKS
jgi:hypothetical protein